MFINLWVSNGAIFSGTKIGLVAILCSTVWYFQPLIFIFVFLCGPILYEHLRNFIRDVTLPTSESALPSILPYFCITYINVFSFQTVKSSMNTLGCFRNQALLQLPVADKLCNFFAVYIVCCKTHSYEKLVTFKSRIRRKHSACKLLIQSPTTWYNRWFTFFITADDLKTFDKKAYACSV